MIIDTHCHYNLDPLFDNWQQHWKKAQQHGVEKSIIVGTDLETSKKAIEISRGDPNLFASIGTHPNATEGSNEKNLTKLSSLLKTHRSQIIAIGETGLDYYRTKEKDRNETAVSQKKNLISHIQLAQEHQLPLILHVRDKEEPETPQAGNAYWDILEILKKHHLGQQPFVLHCISGPKNYLLQALDLGAYIGIAGNITYPNAEQLRDLVKIVPEDRLLLETDAPFLPPQEFRGQKCEPWMIKSTAEFVEKELGVNRDQLLNNSKLIFGI